MQVKARADQWDMISRALIEHAETEDRDHASDLRDFAKRIIIPAIEKEKARETWDQAEAKRKREREKAGRIDQENIFFCFAYVIGRLKIESGIEGSELGKIEAEAIEAFKHEKARDIKRGRV